MSDLDYQKYSTIYLFLPITSFWDKQKMPAMPTKMKV